MRCRSTSRRRRARHGYLQPGVAQAAKYLLQVSTDKIVCGAMSCWPVDRASSVAVATTSVATAASAGNQRPDGRQIRLKRRRVDGADAVQADGAPGVFGEGGGSKVCIPDREPASPATGAGVAAGSLAEDIAHFITTYGGDTSGCRIPARAARAEG